MKMTSGFMAALVAMAYFIASDPAGKVAPAPLAAQTPPQESPPADTGVPAEAGETVDEAPETTQTPTDLRRLLTERRDVLKTRVDILLDSYEVGGASLNDVTPARMDLVDAELELAEDEEQRLALLEQAVGFMKDLENHVTEFSQQTGTPSQDEILAVRAARLAAEVRLERERLHSEKSR